MRATPWIAAICGMVTLLGGCSREPEQVSAESASPPEATADQIQLDGFALGTRLGPHGGIAPGAERTEFGPHEQVFVAMLIRRAPVGTPIRVVWAAPGGIRLGEETKTVRPGQRYMNFAADISTIPPGRGYYAEVWAEGRVVGRVEFEVLPADVIV